MKYSDLHNVLLKTESRDLDATGLVYFMFPNYLPREELFFDYENSVIYIGKYVSDLKKTLQSGTKEFIAVVNTGMYDYDISNRDSLVELAYSKWEKEVPKSISDIVQSMYEIDFINFFKILWITGTSYIDTDSTLSVFELYKVLGGQRYDILRKYFELKEIYSDSYIYSCLLSFIDKSVHPEQVSSQNGRYLKMLDDFKNEYHEVIGGVAQKSYKMNTSKEYRTLWTLMQFGKGEMI